jgi:hypothetical protein
MSGCSVNPPAAEYPDFCFICISAVKPYANEEDELNVTSRSSSDEVSWCPELATSLDMDRRFKKRIGHKVKSAFSRPALAKSNIEPLVDVSYKSITKVHRASAAFPSHVNPLLRLYLDRLNRFFRCASGHCTQFIVRLDREFSESSTGINSFDTAEFSTRIEVYEISQEINRQLFIKNKSVKSWHILYLVSV